MIKIMILFFLILTTASCEKNEALKYIQISDFNWSVLDSLQYKNGSLSSTLDFSFPHILYVTSNECAECIFNFIKFHKSTSKIEGDIRYIYIITGYDDIAFKYYLRENGVQFKDNMYLIMDSLDVFYQNMSKYLGNQMFVLKGREEVIQLLSNPIKNDEMLERFGKMINKGE